MPREQVSPSNNSLQKDRYTDEGAAQHACPLPEEKPANGTAEREVNI